MTPDLSNFIAAQDSGNCFEKALQGIKDGKIGYRWRPLIFPQIYNISMSDREKEFALYSLYEAEAYMCDPTLSKRLRETVQTIIDEYYDYDIADIFGKTNYEKIKSCMTLFDIVSPNDIFENVLNYFFDGERDENVLNAVEWERELFHGEETPYEKLNLKILERAMFDSYGEETKRYSFEMKIASYIRLHIYGYTPLNLGRLYLVHHSDIYDSYRTSGMESELSYIGHELLYEIYKYTLKKCSLEVLEQYVAQFDPSNYFECSLSYDWEIYAIKLQYLIEYILGNPNYEGYVDRLESCLDQDSPI